MHSYIPPSLSLFLRRAHTFTSPRRKVIHLYFTTPVRCQSFISKTQDSRGYYQEPQSPSPKAHQRKMRIDQGTGVRVFEAQRGRLSAILDWKPKPYRNVSLHAWTTHLHTGTHIALCPFYLFHIKLWLSVISCVPIAPLYMLSEQQHNHQPHGSTYLNRRILTV